MKKRRKTRRGEEGTASLLAIQVRRGARHGSESAESLLDGGVGVCASVLAVVAGVLWVGRLVVLSRRAKVEAERNNPRKL